MAYVVAAFVVLVTTVIAIVGLWGASMSDNLMRANEALYQSAWVFFIGIAVAFVIALSHGHIPSW